MTVVYALEEPPESYEMSIFLAGPTPRSNDVASWRPEAIKLLESTGYSGVVYVPEDRSGVYHGDYTGQIDWETRNLNRCDCILFWVPRNMKTMPGLTTNAEFGRYENSGKIVLGAPKGAEHVRYLQSFALKYNVEIFDSLWLAVNAAVDLHSPVLRTAGERDVPLHIWNTASFRQWYAALQAAGNRLDSAELVWNFRVGPNKDKVFTWVLHVNVYVKSEGRNKSNEIVVARPDVASVLMYQRLEPLVDSLVALVREFRSPVNNNQGFVWELPSGSTHTPGVKPKKMASEECFEETGMRLAASRFTEHHARQLAATFSVHKAHLFSVEITDEEVDFLRSQKGVAHTMEGDSEQTYVELTTYGEILLGEVVDWSTVGMIAQVLQ